MPRSIQTLFLALGLTVGMASAHAEGFLVAHHKSNATAVDSETLRKAFTGRLKQWDSGSVVQTAVINNESAPETVFLATTIGMKPGELLNRVQQDVFRGELKRPMTLKSSADCVAAAKSNPGVVCIAAEGTPLAPEVVATAVKK